MRTITSEETVKDFIQLLANHFSISTEWDRRLTAAVQLNDLHKAIDEGKLEEVSGKIEQMGEVSFLKGFLFSIKYMPISSPKL
jgi:hypothetical protein